MGITEESDAIALVVSEETGAISIAVGGKLERDLGEEELKVRLKELLSNQEHNDEESEEEGHDD
jgi:diadenylate cyclase